jgi:hypothetical protein
MLLTFLHHYRQLKFFAKIIFFHFFLDFVFFCITFVLFYLFNTKCINHGWRKIINGIIISLGRNL